MSRRRLKVTPQIATPAREEPLWGVPGLEPRGAETTFARIRLAKSLSVGLATIGLLVAGVGWGQTSDGSTVSPPRPSSASERGARAASDHAHLQEGRRWLKAERPRFAIEHLRRVTTEALWPGADVAMAQMILIAVARLDAAGPGWDTLIAACERPPLETLMDCWEARATWHLRRGEIGASLTLLNVIEQRWPASRLVVLARALVRLSRLGSPVLAREPSVQSRVLFQTLRRWSEEVFSSEQSALLLGAARLAVSLEPEAEDSEALADLVVTRLEADPRALALRGHVAQLRGRFDHALPWNVWAAYTANSIRRTDAASHWRALTRVYLSLGWIDLAEQAHDRTGSDRPFRYRAKAPDADDGRDQAQNGACREWHDWLIAYHPESQLRRHGAVWSDGIEDLQVWNERCALWPAKPTCPDRQGPWRGLPRRIGQQLRRDGPGSDYAARLLCAVDAGIVIPESVRTLAEVGVPVRGKEPAEGDPTVHFARGVIHARTGALTDALHAWSASLAAEDHDGARGDRLLAILDELSHLPRPTLRGAGGALDRRLSQWGRLGRGTEWEAEIWTASTQVRLRLEPGAQATRETAEAAVLASDGAARMLEVRGEVALASGRPEEALPWLRWAERATGASRTLALEARLSRAYAVVGWWDLAERSLVSDVSVKKTRTLEAAAPAPTLPMSCRDLLDRVGRQNIGHLIVRHGEQWLDAVPGLTEWTTDCALAPVAG